MKRCPECRRDYYDETLLYCLDDGSALLDGPGSRDEPATAILSDPGALTTGARADESPTRAQVNAFDETSILQQGARAEPRGSFDGLAAWQNPSSNKKTTPLTGLKPILMVAGTAFFVLLCGLLGYLYFKPAASGGISSIAVLPFENRSGSTDTDYLSDGLADSLIFRLSQLPNLKVSPTSSVMRYRGAGADVEQVAKQLDVDAVMSGRLVQIGERLNISVQLIDARTGKVIWAEQYDRKLSDLLATQREIAAAITEKLQLKLSGDEQGLTKKYTTSNDAYQLYLKGRYHWARRSKNDLDKAIESFKQAIRLDPDFALAYVGLAEAYNSMGKNPDAAPKDSIPFGKDAAARALEIDPSLAEAHSALADSLALYYWDWAGSEREFKRAIELDPNIGYIHLAYSGTYLNAAGRTDEAVREAERAIELEPLSLINNSVLASSYILDRQNDKAITQARKAFDLDPDFQLGRFWLGLAYVANGRYDEAIALDRGRPDAPMGGTPMFVTGLAYARSGRRAEAEQVIAQLREIGKIQYLRTYCIAWIYAALGDKDKAFAELERSFEDRDCYLARARVDPLLDPLRDDPRFQNLLKRMGLKQ